MHEQPADYSDWARVTFWQRSVQAIQEGILLGVKWAIVIAITLIAVSFVLNDYGVVRQRAKNGQWAAEMLQQQLAAQQKQTGVKP